MIFPTTPSQTIGPYFAIGLPWQEGSHAADPGTPGLLTISGVVHDGCGEPVPDALIEAWQADSEGRFADPYIADPSSLAGFRGFARVATDDGGRFGIVTVKPGPVPGCDGRMQAPHVDVSVFARGLLHRLVTRVYFADEPDANASDPVLAAVAPDRRATLIAGCADDGYRFDIRLQGPGETVFFAV